MSFEHFCDRLFKRRDTGVGPDMVPDSAWRSSPSCFYETLYAAYLGLLGRDLPDDKFNLAFMNFIEKGDGDDDTPSSVIRTPGAVRPISLSNTDNKSMSNAIARPWNQHVVPLLHKAQKGGIRGEQMIDHVLDVEFRALQYALSGNVLSGIAAFDMKTAFPALCRSYIFWVLESMGLPLFFIDAIAKLYRANDHIIRLNGRSFMQNSVNSCVKQG